MEPAKTNMFWFTQKFPIAQSLSQVEIAWLENKMVTKRYKKGEKIYSPHKGSTRLYFIKSGIIKISALSEGGRELAMEILGPGDMFGYLSGIIDEKVGYAEAIEESVVSSIDSSEFAHMLSLKPELCKFFVKVLGEKAAGARKKLEDVVFLDVQGRIAKILLELADKAGAFREGSDSNKLDFTISITHKDLAGMAATTRETTTAVLSKLRRMGIAEVERGHVTISDVKKLKSLIVEV